MSAKQHFISYARADKELVQRLAKDLRSAGATVWLDQDLVVGERWDTAIESALHASDGVIVVMTPASVVSENVRDEVQWAIDKRKRVLPVLMAPCELPVQWNRRHYVDFTSSYADGVRRLCEALGLSTQGSALLAAAFRKVAAEVSAEPRRWQDVSSSTGSAPLAASPTPASPAAASVASPASPGGGFRDKLKSGGEGPLMMDVPADGVQLGPLASPRLVKPFGPHKEDGITEPFAIGAMPISTDEYRRFCDSSGYKLPVHLLLSLSSVAAEVSLRDAQAYCNWLGEQTGRSYRLPTAAEWEYVKRLLQRNHFLRVLVKYGGEQGDKPDQPNGLGLRGIGSSAAEWRQADARNPLVNLALDDRKNRTFRLCAPTQAGAQRLKVF